MPVNAEKYFMTHLGFELTTSATPSSIALSVTPTNCAIETYIYIEKSQTPTERDILVQWVSKAVIRDNRSRDNEGRLYSIKFDPSCF